MSDFDVVLERLLTEPEFAAALAADPAGALGGYRLAADEVALLRTQVSGDAGGQHAVEVRTNQSSVFGMLSAVGGLADLPNLTGGGFATAGEHVGPGVPPVGSAAFRPVAGVAGFGGVAATEGFAPFPAAEGPGPFAATEGFGAATEGFGGLAATEGFGAAEPVPGAAQGLGPAPVAVTQGLGAAPGGASGAYGAQQGLGAAPPAGAQPPDGYRTRVDVDGDGRWDRHAVRGRVDGGVDILVDVNRDGAVDFIGRDLDADGLVDVADYDVDRDGVLDRRGTDVDGDGWLDRGVAYPGLPPDGPRIGAQNSG